MFYIEAYNKKMPIRMPFNGIFFVQLKKDVYVYTNPP